MKIRVVQVVGMVLLGLVVAACASTQAASTEGAGRVFFTSPESGATVSAPVNVTMGADGFTVEPAGEVNAGRGHLHIMVDTDCVAAGQVVPSDAQHLHFGKAQMEAELDLAPGPHTLCLQAADGAHVALAGDGMSDTITVTVK